MRHESRQEEKIDLEESQQAKNVAFCVSPPSRNPAKLDTQHIVQKLRNGRMNAMNNTERQPMKADHSTGTHLMDSQRYTDNSLPKQENGKFTNSGANKFESEDRFTDHTVERKENKKESMLRMLKMCAENKRNIRKLRDEVAEAKTNIWKCCEEEEQWNCRSDMHKNRVNASLRKIENLKMDKPHLFPKSGEGEVMIDEVRGELMSCRADLIFHLSQVEEVMQEAIKEKTMERRRLGVTYPKWFLPEFQEEYLKYRKTHGFHQPSLFTTRPVCPAIDIAVIDQKGYNIGQNFKILIYGRQFSHRNLGLTQVLTTVKEESCSHGEFGLVFPKTALNKTESRKLFREPQTTSKFDVEYFCSTGCSNALMSPTDPQSLMFQILPNASMLEKKRSTKYLPPLRNTPPPNDNINTTDVSKFWKNIEKVKSHSTIGTRSEGTGTPPSNRTFVQSESDKSIIALQRKKTLKQFDRTANEKNYQIIQELLPPLTFIDHVPKRNVRQSQIILPDIRKCNEKPLATDGDTKPQINMSSKYGSYSILCNPKMVAVKILHRDKRSNEMTYLTDLVNREMIPPFSVTRQGSLIPVGMKYLSELFRRQLNVPRFGGTQSTMSTTYTPSLPAVASRNSLYKINKASNEFDENADVNTMKPIKSSPFYNNQLNQSNSSHRFAHQKEMISPSEQQVIRSRHNEGKNVKVLDEEKQYLAASNRTQNLILSETRNIFYCNELLTPECLSNKNEKKSGNLVQKPSRIPVLCRGNKTDKTSGNAAQKLSRIPVLLKGTKQLGNTAHKSSRIPVLCRGTKTLGNTAHKPSRIPEHCQETKRAVHTTHKPSRIPVFCQAKTNTRKCTSSSEISSDVAIPYGKQIFVPHPPTKRKPTRTLLTKRLFSKYTKI